MYLIFSNHYMGIDGDYVENYGYVTTEEEAIAAVRKLEAECEHENSDYDILTYSYELLEEFK